VRSTKEFIGRGRIEKGKRETEIKGPIRDGAIW